MGTRLAERGFDPEVIVTSPAVRSMATAVAIAEQIEHPREAIVIDDRLYGASASQWFEIIQGLDDELQWVMYIGHNPALTELVNYLSPHHVDTANVWGC